MKTIHIAKGNPDLSQNGSALWPFRVTTAQQFDAVFRLFREPTRFLLAPGEYATMGSWAFQTTNYALLPPNASLVGTGGSQATVIRLADDYDRGDAALARQAVPVLNCGGRTGEPSHQCTVSGLTIRAEAAKGRPSVGLSLWTGGALVEDVVVTGVSGDWTSMVEGFAILVMDSTGARNGGNTIRRCRVAFDTPDTYYNGICLGSLTPEQAPNLIESCSVQAAIPATGRRSHTAYAIMANAALVRCAASGFDHFCFSDTGDTDGVEIAGCRGDFGYTAVAYPALSTQANAIKSRRRIRVSRCDFHNARPSSDHAIGLSIQDQSPNHDQIVVEDITMENCLFTSTLSPGKFYACSILASRSERICVRDCTLPANAQTGLGVYAPTSIDRVRFANLTFMR